MEALGEQKRPAVEAVQSLEEFQAWYWLKEELVVMCQWRGLSTSGLKRALEARIAADLGGSMVLEAPVVRRTGAMPAAFAPEMRIGVGWRCRPALGRYFRERLGSGFRFNAAMRAFIHEGAGRTLEEAERCYLESVGRGRAESEIAPSLEYNRHFREYFKAHPGASKEEAIAAWWELRGRRKL